MSAHFHIVEVPLQKTLRPCGAFTVNSTIKVLARFEEREGGVIRLFNPALPTLRVGDKPIALAQTGRSITMQKTVEILLEPGVAEILEPPVIVDKEASEVAFDFPNSVCRKLLMLGKIPGTNDMMVTVVYRLYAERYYKFGKEMIESYENYQGTVERLEKELDDKYG